MIKLADLLDAGDTLIAQIDEARGSLQSDIGDISGSLSQIDSLVDNLGFEARQLQRLIDEARAAAPHQHDPVVAATIAAVDNLITLLNEATEYFTAGRDLAAYGTLAMCDEHADDLRAALRLRNMQQRRAS